MIGSRIASRTWKAHTRRIAIGCVAGSLALLATACAGVAERINPGTAAIIINYTRGVDANGIPKSYRVVPAGELTNYDVVTERLVEYPTKDNTLIMVRAVSEGKVTGDDSVACQDKGGIPVNVDSRTTWAIDPDPQQIVQLYLRRPGMPLTSSDQKDQANIEDQEVRPAVRTALAVACADFTYTQIAGADKQRFYDDAGATVKAELAKVHVLLRSFQGGGVYLADAQSKALADTANAQQGVMTAQFAKQRATADAAAAVAQAEGQKQVKIKQAEADAESIRIVNEQLKQSPDYVAYLYAQKWNGQTPQVVTSGQQPGLVLGVPQPSAKP